MELCLQLRDVMKDERERPCQWDNLLRECLVRNRQIEKGEVFKSCAQWRYLNSEPACQSLDHGQYLCPAYGLSKIILFCCFFYIIPVETLALPRIYFEMTELSVVALVLVHQKISVRRLNANCCFMLLTRNRLAGRSSSMMRQSTI